MNYPVADWWTAMSREPTGAQVQNRWKILLFFSDPIPVQLSYFSYF
jgi:hypothetical protein